MAGKGYGSSSSKGGANYQNIVQSLEDMCGKIGPIDIPEGGTLWWWQRDAVFNETWAMPSVRYRKAWGQRALTVRGQEGADKEGAARMAIDIMHENLAKGWSSHPQD